MLKMAASIVIVFFVTLWATGNDIASVKNGLIHWADGNSEIVGKRTDWGD